jgi:hypothetical protein
VVEHLPGKHEILRLNHTTKESVRVQTIYKHISFKQWNNYLGVILDKIKAILEHVLQSSISAL